MVTKEEETLGKIHDCLIIGAGLAGVSAARVLREAGLDVLLLDKGRGLGGRIATRERDGARVDYGLQFYAATSEDFDLQLRRWSGQGWLSRWPHEEMLRGGYPFWPENVRSVYVSDGGNRRFVKRYAEGLDVLNEVDVARLEVDDSAGVWTAYDRSERAWRARSLLATTPVPQGLRLIDSCGDLKEALGSARPSLDEVVYEPYFALTARLDRPLKIGSPGVRAFPDGPVLYVADAQHIWTHSPTPALVAFSNTVFAREHLEDDADDVRDTLLNAVAPWLGDAKVLDAAAHRWRFAQPTRRYPNPFHAQLAPAPFAMAGDGFAAQAKGTSSENAFLSGSAAGRLLADTLLG